MEKEEQKDNSLKTIAIILLCCGAAKLLHLLGVITVEGEFSYGCNLIQSEAQQLQPVSLS